MAIGRVFPDFFWIKTLIFGNFYFLFQPKCFLNSLKIWYYEGKSAASFCYQVAAWSQLCFATLIWWKITKLLKSQQKTLEKVSADLESLEFYKNFGVRLTKFENNQILLNKISHRFLLTTKLYARWKIIIRHLWFKTKIV